MHLKGEASKAQCSFARADTELVPWFVLSLRNTGDPEKDVFSAEVSVCPELTLTYLQANGGRALVNLFTAEVSEDPDHILERDLCHVRPLNLRAAGKDEEELVHSYGANNCKRAVLDEQNVKVQDIEDVKMQGAVVPTGLWKLAMYRRSRIEDFLERVGM